MKKKQIYNDIIPYNLKIYIYIYIYSINKKLTIKNHITLMYKYSIIIFIKNLNNLSCLSSYKILFYQKKKIYIYIYIFIIIFKF